MQRFLLICALPKQSAPDWRAAQGEAAKLFAELDGDARGAYVATTAYSWFLFRDAHDRTKQARHQAAQEAAERYLRDPSAPWTVPASDVVHDYAREARASTGGSLGNPLWLRLSDVAPAPSMRSPGDFVEALSANDLSLVDDLVRQTIEWFEAKHEECHYNTNVDANRAFPSRVWDEFVRRARQAGWTVDARGAMVVVKMPPTR